MMNQYTTAAAWEDYQNAVYDVCNTYEGWLNSVFRNSGSSLSKPDDDHATNVGQAFLNSAIRSSSVSAARNHARSVFRENGLSSLFDEKDAMLMSELRDWVKSASRNCWELMKE